MDLKLASDLLKFVIGSDKENVRKLLHKKLLKLSHSEPQFYNTIVENIESMKLTNKQWFELILKVPNRILLDNRKILLKINPEQRIRLGIDL